MTTGGTKKRKRSVKAVAIPKEVDIVTCKHEWDLKWKDGGPHGARDGFRICKLCHSREWRLACWTADQFKADPGPGNLKQVFEVQRPDLNRAKVQHSNPGFVWARTPHLIRQANLISERVLHTPIVIAGAGAIGSFSTLALIKMGMDQVTVYDPSMLGRENLGPQLYGIARLEKDGGDLEASGNVAYRHEHLVAPNRDNTRKTYALERAITTLKPARGTPLTTIHAALKEQRVPKGSIVISAVDSMLSRRDIWELVKGNERVTWFIDPRMGGEFGIMYVINPCSSKDIALYEKTLYTDEEALEEPCAERATAYTSFLLAGTVCKTVKDLLMRQPYIRTMQWDIRRNKQLTWLARPQDTGESRDVLIKKKYEGPPRIDLAVVAAQRGEEVRLPLPLPTKELCGLEGGATRWHQDIDEKGEIPGGLDDRGYPAIGTFETRGGRLLFCHFCPHEGRQTQRWWWRVQADGTLRNDG